MRKCVPFSVCADAFTNLLQKRFAEDQDVNVISIPLLVIGRKWLCARRIQANEERNVPKFSLPVIAVGSLLVALTTTSVAQTLPSDIPLGIVCYNQKSQTWVMGYLNTFKENGIATYRGPTHGVANLNADRILVPPTDRVTALDCYGKSLDQLRDMGRLIPVQRMPGNQ
jgi:hypothetical protein